VVLILQCGTSEKVRVVATLTPMSERSDGHPEATRTIPVSKPVAAFLLKEMGFISVSRLISMAALRTSPVVVFCLEKQRGSTGQGLEDV